MIRQGDVFELKNDPDHTYEIIRKIDNVPHLNKVLSRLRGPQFPNLQQFADERIYPVYLVKNINNAQIWLISHSHTYLSKENMEVICGAEARTE